MSYRIAVIVDTKDEAIASELADLMFTAVMEASEEELEWRGLSYETMPQIAVYVGPNLEATS